MQKLNKVIMAVGILTLPFGIAFANHSKNASEMGSYSSPIANEIDLMNDNDIIHYTANNQSSVYNELDFTGMKRLSRDIFEKAYQGHLNLKKAGKLSADKDILTVCDFSKSANEPRMWIIDLKKKKILFNSLVAHGQGTGEEFATKFSNTENSHQSSIGFFVTKETYIGDNGFSLRLDGMDRGFNDNALQRAIVLHGADYVSKDFIQSNQRLGRSWGCPAVPRKLTQPIINTIKEGTTIFIYYPDTKYFASSKWLSPSDKLSENPRKRTYIANATAETNTEDDNSL